jgi:hypothetical protein
MRRACALSLLLAASCSRCAGPRSAGSAEELLPPHPSGALLTAPLGLFAQHAAALSDRVATLPGGEQVSEARKGISTQLGFDPLTREGLLSAGLDPDRGAALALELHGDARGAWVLALPLTSAEKFLATFDRLARERAGYAVRTDEARGEVRVALYARAADAETRNRIAVAVVRGYGLVARGEDPAAQIIVRTREQSLAADPLLASARGRLGAQDLLVIAPAASELPKRFLGRGLPGDVSFSLSGSAQGIAARFFAQLPESDAAQARAVLPGGGAALVELLPGQAPFRARLGVAPAELLKFAERLPQLAQVLDKLKGLEREALASVKPGIALSLGVAKNVNIGQAIDYGLDFRRKSPFDTVELVALAQVADRPRLLKALGALAALMPALGAKVARSGDDFQVTYAAGKGARFGVRGDMAYVLGGEIAPQDLRPTPRTVNPEAAALYRDEGAALRVDFGKLSDAMRVLPESAYGSGPQAYVARSLVGQVIEPLRPLRITLAAQAYSDGLGATLDLELVAP